MPVNFKISPISQDVFVGKLHIFLTCWAVNRDLKNSDFEGLDFAFFEELALKCVYKSLISGSVDGWQIQLLIDELPRILACKYPVVNDIAEITKMFITKMIEINRMQGNWMSCKQLGYLIKILNNIYVS